MIHDLVAYSSHQECLLPATAYWLVKFAPFRTSWRDIVRNGSFTLRGVRSHEAAKNIAAMRPGDLALFYHSQEEKQIMGVLEVVSEPYQDPGSADTRWKTTDFKPVKSLAVPITLEALKVNDRFSQLGLIMRPRLAVMPVRESDFTALLSQDRPSFFR